MEKLTYLGLSADTIHVLSDLANDIFQLTEFDIVQNIPVPDQINKLKTTHFTFSVYHHELYPYPKSSYLLGVSSSQIKTKVFNFFKQEYGIEENNYGLLIHPTSYISKTSHIDQGVVVEPLVSISSYTQINFGVTIKRSSTVGHDCNIGKLVTINLGVKISGNVQIGPSTLLGTGAVVLDNIKIGSNSIIGAGSVVTRDIPDHVVAYGNPCKVIRSI